MKATSVIPVKLLTRTAMLFALTLAIQALRLPSVVTGPLVNFMLVLASLTVGTAGGVIIGTFTPWIALAAGILPAPLAPAVPFIMAGNALLCLLTGTFAAYSHFVRTISVVIGSVLKFAVIAGSATYVLTLPPKLTSALMFPQLTNALIGGCVAVAVMASVRTALVAQKTNH